MRRSFIPACAAGFFALAASCAITGLAQPSMPGGSSPTSVTKPEVVTAATFAIKAEEKAMREQQKTPPAKLELVKILGAEEQVVAGMNYRLKLRVKENGKEREAEAVVWWQAWRTPDPYQLTSWKWLSMGVGRGIPGR